MFEFFELILNSAILWVYLQAIVLLLISALYDFAVPWIIWVSFVLMTALCFVRNPSPQPNITDKILGLDPISLGKKNDVSDLCNSDGNKEEPYCMRAVAHRGGGYDYPENSISAFRNSKQKGCTAVEFDVALTKDNIPIVYHDVTIERLTGQIGVIREMTWDQLKELDITYNHPLRDKFRSGEKIALLEDVLEECIKNDQRIFMDIKEKSLDIVQIILNMYKKYPKLFERAIVTSFNPIVIYMIRRKEPRVVCSLSWRPFVFSRKSYSSLDGPGAVRFNNPLKHIAAWTLDVIHSWALPRFTYYLLGLSVILLHKDIVSAEVVRQWHKRGVRVIVWTINLPSEKLHFSRLLKVTYLTDTLLTESNGHL
ncbi:glycerophosphodiester phosphodiesterase 1 [Cephus cinctus]|uniref:Glycerophosphodiester phosphodiesterase 1 n=1 Tax=Cephus cinctus TaxID=211228 RepID=A0AAJ7CGI3_CEPCN|nr:glycerophosphodiester phosphodiesterase 1 [Cephus cinctus]XP_024935822.1 glycerophosphodiester phosphodiesterase 1 [Cephus cinctus]